MREKTRSLLSESLLIGKQSNLSPFLLFFLFHAPFSSKTPPLIAFRGDSVDDWDTISSAPARSIARENYASLKEAMLARAIRAGTVDRAGKVPTASVSSVCAELGTEGTIARQSRTLAGRILAYTEVYAWEKSLGKLFFFNIISKYFG